MKFIRLISILIAVTTISGCGNAVPENISDASCLQSHPGVKQADCSATKLVTYEILTLVGNPTSTTATPVDGAGSGAVLGNLRLPAFDSNGDLYAIDEHTWFGTTNLRIRRVRVSDRSVTTLYGPVASTMLVTGCTTANMGLGGGAIVSGKYYFSCNRAIFVYDPSVPATPPSVFAGDAATSGTTDNTTRALARFSGPRSILPLDNDNLLVLDGHAIRRVGVTTDSVQVYCGSISSSGNTDASCATALFSTPQHLVRSGDNLFVLDGPDVRIRRVAITANQVFAHANLPASGTYGTYGTMAIQNNTLHLMTDRWSVNQAYYFQVSTSGAANFDLQFRLKRSAVAYDGIGLSANVRNTISYLSTFYNGKWTFLDRHVASNTSASFVRTFGGAVLTY